MPGIKDIAKLAGVSVATVSNALNNRKNVGDETRKKILDIAQELNYDLPAKNPEEQNTGKNIVFHFSDFSTLYYHDILHGISDYVFSKGYNILVSSDRDLKRYRDPSISCGCISMDFCCDDSLLMDLANRDYPIIVLDRELTGEGIKSIVVNNYNSQQQLVEGLVKAGMKSFAWLGGLDTPDNRERLKAFKDVLHANGISCRRTDFYEGNWLEDSGDQTARLLMLTESMPDALVCANDMMAIGAIRKFRREGIRVPEDISVSGFDDVIISRYIRLTTVSVPNYERGYLAAQSLIEILEGRGDYDTMRLGARVKWRESTKGHL